MNREENKKRQEELLKMHPKVSEQMKQIPGVLGVGVGLKQVNNEITENIVFIVFVEEKKAAEDVLGAELIPLQVLGVETDVQQVPVANEEAADTTRYRPVKGGAQITNGQVEGGKISNGTLGIVCTYNDQERTNILLSNHHVLFAKGGGKGTKIYQPTKKDDKTCCCCVCSEGNVLGTVIKGAKNTFVDCAIGTLENVGSKFEKNYVLDIGEITGVAQAVVGETVKKYGRTTKLTEGRVLAINTLLMVDSALVDQQIQIQSKSGPDSNFSKGGDSGSVVVNSAKKVIGLHYSGNNSDPTGPYYSYSNKIQNVVSELGITIGPIPVKSEELTEVLPSFVSEEEDAFLAENPLFAKYKAILEKTADGRAILNVINSNVQEVLYLVNNDRESGVVWQRNQGPAFLAAYQDIGENPTKPIPQEIEGVKLSDMIANMGAVLSKNGSNQLKWAINNYQGSVLAFLPTLTNLNGIVAALNADGVSCAVMNLIWQMIWNENSAFYLPLVFQEGLKIDALKIDVPPLKKLDIGNLPKITMFKEPVLGYMEMELNDTILTGLPTVKEGSYSCKMGSEKDTEIAFTLTFSELNFSGKYGVSAGGGIAGCAIAGAAKIIGGGGDLMGAMAAVDGNIDEALWYRGPLSKSDAGQMMLGAYYLNNPSINNLVQEPGSILAQSMKQGKVQQTTADVNKATSFYKNQQTRLQNLEETAPEIGTVDQYGTGGLSSAYCVIMCNQKINDGQDPDGNYARLKNHIIHFTEGTKKYQEDYPGTQPVGGDNGILNRIGDINMEEFHEYVLQNGPYPLIHPDTLEVLEEMEPLPLNIDEMRAAYAMKCSSWEVEAGGNTANGTFSDTGLDVEIDVEMSIAKQADGSVQVTITSLKGKVGTLKIKLSEGSGWWPGLFDKVTNWIANAGFFQDLLKDHINDGLNQDSVKDFLAGVINGALKKL